MSHKQNEKEEKTTIPSDDGFGMTNVGEPAKFKEASVKEVEDLQNVVSID